MEAFSRENGTKPKPIDDGVLTALASRKWPGNIRELKNVVERMAILSGDRVTIADLPEDPHESPFGEEESSSDASGPHDVTDEEPTVGPGDSMQPARSMAPPANYLTLREFRDQSERRYIVETLKITGWNISRTAIILGVERTNLHKKIRAYQVKRGES
jgi:DNA-binding NtrC family response regulator